MSERSADDFDYVIVGAGSAGCVLANRLSADPNVRVALLEAGGSNRSVLVKMPSGVGRLIRDAGPQNWGFYTTPQKHLNDRKLWWPRGKGLGGSSAINGMIYIRGHARDYDQWRQLGLEGWSYADVLPYFKRNEHCEAGGDFWRGEGGPLWVSVPRSGNPLFQAFLDAGRQAGYPSTRDFNGAQQEGVGPYQLTIRDGQRWSAANAYLAPILIARRNLEVLSGARATRILFQGTRAIAVEHAAGPGKPLRITRAAREVIVCTGAVQSPQLLQLSGIGDPELLAQHGIPVVAPLKDVGRNLQDHLDLSIVHECVAPVSAYSAIRGHRELLAGVDYLLRGQGPGRFNWLETGGFLRTRGELDRPDIQLHFVAAIMIEHGRVQIQKDGYTLHVCQLRPESLGTIAIGSADPFADPLIDPNYLATENDRRTCRDAVKIARDIFAQAAFDPYRGAELAPGPQARTDAEIDEFVRGAGETIYHPVGTCRMGADPDAVLDAQLRVRGVEALRVVDASAMPTLIGGNTNAPTMMMAEKAADMILGRKPPAPLDAPPQAVALSG